MLPRTQLTQRGRFIVLIVEVLFLSLVSYLISGEWIPPRTSEGFWFYTALLGLVLGSRLDTPHFVAPADVVLYAVPAIIALIFESTGKRWSASEHAVYRIALGYCIGVGVAGILAIVLRTEKDGVQRRLAESARVVAEILGTPRMIYSFVVFFAVFVNHRDSASEGVVITVAWAVLTWINLPDIAAAGVRRLRGVWNNELMVETDGSIIAYETPGSFLIRPGVGRRIEPRRAMVAMLIDGTAKLCLALERFSDSDGTIVRAVEMPEGSSNFERRAALLRNGEVSILDQDAFAGLPACAAFRERIIGVVTEETSVQRLHFRVVPDVALEEGRLVTVCVSGSPVIFQITNGVTRDEVVAQKNRYGFVRAQARKIGKWDPVGERFAHAKWVPEPNAPVTMEARSEFKINADAIGHFPHSNFPAHLKKVGADPVGLHAMVTHNTAIIGILGVGKSSLAIELLERMMAVGIKVVCIDLTNQYAKALAPHYHPIRHQKMMQVLNAKGAEGRTIKKDVHEEGGSVQKVGRMLQNMMKKFLTTSPARLCILNPAEFEIWKQDKSFKVADAPMSRASPAQVTQLVSESLLRAVAELGMTDRARVCIVYEEAHSLVPEGNSAVSDGDKAASNGTARAILQGRKYGMGCLLISQRTANVTKTILNQCNTVFAMRTFDDTGKDFLANYLGREFADLLPALEERHAVFFGRGSACENPAMIRLNDQEPWLTAFRAKNPPPVVADDAAESAAPPMADTMQQESQDQLPDEESDEGDSEQEPTGEN